MKISATIASAWWRGEKEQAIAMINGQYPEFPDFIQKAMDFGKGAHTAWELEGKITRKLPVIFKMPQFEVLSTELKMHKQLTDTDWLTGVIDAVAIGQINEEPVVALVDYKTGKKVDRWQSCIYHYLIHDSQWWRENIGDINPSHFLYLTLDKHTHETSTEIVKLTMPQTLEEWALPDATTYTTGYNFIMTVLTEIKDELGIP